MFGQSRMGATRITRIAALLRGDWEGRVSVCEA